MRQEVYYVLGFIVLMTFIMIARIRRRRKEPQVGLFDSRQVELRARESLESLIVQMQEVAREQIAKADSKIRMLNQLVADADQRKKELEALLERLPEVAAPKPPPPSKPANPLHEKVYALQDKGKSPEEICRELSMEIGEVDMILGLRKL